MVIGVQCGPPMDVLVVTPGGEVRSALADLAQGGYFTCELRPESVLPPDGTHVMRLSWVAPARRGEYTAAAGLRRAEGLGNPSALVRFTVR